MTSTNFTEISGTLSANDTLSGAVEDDGQTLTGVVALEWKASTATAVFLETWIAGLLVLYFGNQFRKSQRATVVQSILNCMAAGILLSASLVHLLHDAEDTESMLAWGRFGVVTHFLCGSGFLILLALEYTMHGAGHSDGHSADGTERLVVRLNQERDALALRTQRVRDDNDNKEIIIERDDDDDEDDVVIISSVTDSQTITRKGIRIDTGSSGGSTWRRYGQRLRWAFRGSKPPLSNVLFVALFCESIFTGCALGIAHTRHNVVAVGVALISHVWAEAFALMAHLSAAVDHQHGQRQRYSKRQLHWANVWHAAGTPIGAALGALLATVLSDIDGDDGHSRAMIYTSSVFLSIVSGFFLYVSIVEIITVEMDVHGAARDGPQTLIHRLVRFFAVALGYVLMSLLVLWI